MRIVVIIISFIFFFLTRAGFAQSTAGIQQSRILIILDGSSSMLNKWSDEKTRFQIASDIILRLMDSVYHVNKDVEFSLRVIGHQHTVPMHDCYDTRNEVMFSKDNYTQMSFRLENIFPQGITPIAYSLQEAANYDLVDVKRYAYSIVLITDGGESCGGNICEVVKKLIKYRVYFKPYIVSLVDYAPLRTEYDCMGDFLQVSKGNEISKAVTTIVDAFRPMLTISKTDYSQIATHLSDSVITLPMIVSKTEPKPVIKADTIIPPPPPPLPKRDMIQVTQSAFPNFVMKQLITNRIPAPIPGTSHKMPNIPLPKIDDEPITIPTPQKKEDITAIQTNYRLRQFLVSSPVVPLVFSTIKIPRIPLPKIPEEKAAVTPPPPPPPRKPDTIASVPSQPITNISEVSKETTLQIYFTDGHGKYYYTSPQLVLKDKATGKIVKKFYRTLDPQRDPDPQDGIPPGIYSVYIEGRGGNQFDNILVEPNKHNKREIVVGIGTLQFNWDDGDESPVNEFTATVVKRGFDGGPIVKQKCSLNLNYEPGNYYVEANTLPVKRWNTDVEFGSSSVLYVPHPGWVQFTNTNKVGKVNLYHVLGDKYAKFYTVEVNGNIAMQKLKLLPGSYQVRFMKNPQIPYAEETIIPFLVKSKQVTEMEVK